jgi:hypothetical protein
VEPWYTAEEKQMPGQIHSLDVMLNAGVVVPPNDGLSQPVQPTMLPIMARQTAIFKTVSIFDSVQLIAVSLFKRDREFGTFPSLCLLTFWLRGRMGLSQCCLPEPLIDTG